MSKSKSLAAHPCNRPFNAKHLLSNHHASPVNSPCAIKLILILIPICNNNLLNLV